MSRRWKQRESGYEHAKERLQTAELDPGLVQ